MKRLAIFAMTFGLVAGQAAAEQLANPAASYCTKQGGQYEIVQESTGARGFCSLPEGRRVDAWAYFREAAKSDEDPPGLVNPAAAFCVNEGGAYRIVTDASGAQRGMCKLPDQPEVDAWENFRKSG